MTRSCRGIQDVFRISRSDLLVGWAGRAGTSSACHAPRFDSSSSRLFLRGRALGQVAEEVDGVPDVLVADLAAPRFHEVRRIGRRLALDSLFDGLEDLGVGAAMIPLLVNQVCRLGAGGRGDAIAFSLETV